MGRRIKEDFENLLNFFDTYNLSEILKNTEFRELLSFVHKRYYSFLVLTIELQDLVENPTGVHNISQKQYYYILETCSDVGQVLFLIANGCYKGAKLLLRSSIENFIKGVCLDSDPKISSTKSVYEVFDLAKESETFSGSKSEIFKIIHNIYAELCKDVHTADLEHMEHITALNTFPNYDIESAKVIKNHLMKLLPAYITLLCLKYNSFYHGLYYTNKEIVQENLMTFFKKEVNNLNSEE